MRPILEIFRATIGVELNDADLAASVTLTADDCRILLGVLEKTGAIERPRHDVSVCHPWSWLTAPAVRVTE
jgi:hypothetical protein